MATETNPIVGDWYEDTQSGQHFEVVHLDEDNGLVQIQDIDGETQELGIDEWYERDFEPAEPPEGWDEEDDEDWEEEDEDWDEEEEDEDDAWD